jgi:hypothetical protein
VSFSYVITASRGEFEITCPTLGLDEIRFSPTHEGLMLLWSLLETLPEAPVKVAHLDPLLTGLPAGYDSQGFVEAALTLRRLGWHSSPGGDA